jgi:phenylacetate-coenzyme A ligase PaaK-like adenylate-forming protein
LDNNKSFESILYRVNEGNFDEIALQVFRFQAENNPVYAAYLKNLSIHTGGIYMLQEIPFLPISFFKTQTVKAGSWEPEVVFQSSGTTGMASSRHAVKDLPFYHRHSTRCFEFFFGPVSNYHFFALLPSYLERGNSSLVTMMDYFIRESKSEFSGFYLSDHAKLMADVQHARKDTSRKIIVWGVSFALLDLAEEFTADLSDCLIFETGGMKGRRQEITREQLHDTLTKTFGVSSIFSEYGMTELFSQAYSNGGTTFHTPPWMKVLIREVGDPFALLPAEKPGGLNVIDLANVNTVSFIETEDVGVLKKDGAFEVRGRLDNSDIRGCNLLVE